jgi:glycosyltransferase involved in cell wall biosynthesis
MVPSGEDAERLSRPAVVYPNAIPLRQQPVVPKVADLVFSGNLEYAPNLDAVRWFARDIWPRLRTRRPSLSWLIVGRNHGKAQRETQLEGAHFTGPVDDALSTIASARVAIVPVRAGSGTRVKILEAWAAGLPVVSTSLGAEGLGRDTPIRIADKAEEFARAVQGLLDGGSDQQGRDGRLLYERDYNWQAVWTILEREGL